MIYLDHNATTRTRPEAADAMRPLLAETFGNPSGAYAAGRDARGALERARRQVAAAVGMSAAEVIFTSGGTEANNLALFGVVAADQGAGVVCSPIDHSSVIECARELERRGARLSWLPVDSYGRIDPAAVSEAIDDRTAVVSVGWANNEIGTVQNITAIAAACHERGVLLHSDAVQAFGKVAVDLGAVDLASLSAHKFGGPKGVGVLCVRRGIALRPLAFGGKQERGLRPGTENIAGAVGLGVAAEAASREASWTPDLRERLWESLSTIPGSRRYSPRECCLPNTLLAGFDGIRGESMVAALDLEGVAVSVGSACAAGSGEPSHVLAAVGHDREAARTGVRFSSGRETTGEEIETAAAAVALVVQRMREVGAEAASA
jgi:cysteine desulfurase